MRYQVNKEQSAEFLRLAVPLMASQDAALHPVSYTLWYEHVAGINPPLSEILAARVQAREALSENEVHELYGRYIAPSDQELLERLNEKLRALIEETAESAATAGEETGQYGESLEQTRAELVGAASLESVRTIVAELLEETLRVQSTVRTASEKLDLRAQEVRQLTEQLEQARAEALLDPLTGLKNRRGFERAIGELDGIGGNALLVADIDHFKQINDAHGHLLGDKVLRAIGRILNENSKRRDLVGRWGGEEFTLLLVRTPLEGARAVAEQIRSTVTGLRIRKADGSELEGQVTLSLGIAVAQASETFEDLMRRADAAMYSAKRKGRNRVFIAEQT